MKIVFRLKVHTKLVRVNGSNARPVYLIVILEGLLAPSLGNFIDVKKIFKTRATVWTFLAYANQFYDSSLYTHALLLTYFLSVLGR